MQLVLKTWISIVLNLHYLVLHYKKNYILELHTHITTKSVSDGNWVFLQSLSIGKHVIYFKGSLRNATAPYNNNNNSANFTFAGHYGWDYPTTYHITVTNSSPSPTSSIQTACLVR